jgi:hypothetical protein
MKIEKIERMRTPKLPTLVLRVTNQENKVVGEVKIPYEEVELGVEVGVSEGKMWDGVESTTIEAVNDDGRILHLRNMVVRVHQYVPLSEKGFEEAWKCYRALADKLKDDIMFPPLSDIVRGLRGGYSIELPGMFGKWLGYPAEIPSSYLRIIGEDGKIKIEYCYDEELPLPLVEVITGNEKRQLLQSEQIVLERGDEVTLNIPETYILQTRIPGSVYIAKKALLQILYTES